MSCVNIKENLSAYIDNELPPEERTEMDVHLALCQECSLYLEELRNTITAAGKIEDVEPPAWLTQKVMARVSDEPGVKKGILQKLFFPLHIKLPIEAFATIAVAVTALLVFRAVQPEIERTKMPSEMLQQESDLMEDRPAEVAASSSGANDIQERQRTMSPVLMKEEQKTSDDFYRPDEAEPKTRSEVFKLKSAPAKKQDKAVLTFAVSIFRSDLGRAISEIEEIVKELEAEIVRVESFETNTVFTVKLDSARLFVLHKRLIPAGGRLAEGSIETEDLHGDVEVEIEVLINH